MEGGQRGLSSKSGARRHNERDVTPVRAQPEGESAPKARRAPWCSAIASLAFVSGCYLEVEGPAPADVSARYDAEGTIALRGARRTCRRGSRRSRESSGSRRSTGSAASCAIFRRHRAAALGVALLLACGGDKSTTVTDAGGTSPSSGAGSTAMTMTTSASEVCPTPEHYRPCDGECPGHVCWGTSSAWSRARTTATALRRRAATRSRYASTAVFSCAPMKPSAPTGWRVITTPTSASACAIGSARGREPWPGGGAVSRRVQSPVYIDM